MKKQVDNSTELVWPEGDVMFGKLIKDRRQELGLTQRQLGEMCGYGEASADRVIQLWEHDQQPVPLDKIRALAKALEIPIDSLIP